MHTKVTRKSEEERTKFDLSVNVGSRTLQQSIHKYLQHAIVYQKLKDCTS